MFFFPAASHVEKEGTFTKTQRLLQWRDKAVEPPGDERSDLWFFYHLGRMLRERLAASTDPRDRPLLDLDLGLPRRRARDAASPTPRRCCGEINGYDVADRQAPSTATCELKDDGSTAVRLLDLLRRLRGRGQPGRAPQAATGSRARRRRSGAGRGRANRRMLYNRASADPDGKPWSERKKLRLVGRGRRRSGPGTTSRTSRRPSRPGYVPPRRARPGPDALRGDDPFIMQADGKALAVRAERRCWTGRCRRTTSRSSRRSRNPLYGQQGNPTRQGATAGRTTRRTRIRASRAREVFPFVLTTYRLTEHHTAGGMSRQLPYLSELQPEMFGEVSPELAAERGLEHRAWATSSPAAAAIEARVLVTERMAPLRVDGHVVHQIGLPYHWGSSGARRPATRPTTCSASSLDPNVLIQESQGRHLRHPARAASARAQMTALLRDLRTRAGITVETGNVLDTAAGSPHVAHVEEAAHPAEGRRRASRRHRTTSRATRCEETP